MNTFEIVVAVVAVVLLGVGLGAGAGFIQQVQKASELEAQRDAWQAAQKEAQHISMCREYPELKVCQR